MYQTVYAREPGSAEMPSAGRAFSPQVLKRLGRQGVGFVTLTLHTGVDEMQLAVRRVIHECASLPDGNERLVGEQNPRSPALIVERLEHDTVPVTAEQIGNALT